MNFKKGDVVNVVGTCANGIILSVNEDTCEVFFPETTYVKSSYYKLNDLRKTTKVIKIIDKNNEKLNDEEISEVLESED